MLHDEKLESTGGITRKALIASGIGTVAVLGLGGSAFAQGSPSEAAMQAALKSGIPPDDGLAHPIPYTPPLGIGKDRGLALGGGAIYLVSWYSGYFTSLAQNGVDLKLADVMVGTSAGTLGNYAILMDTVAQMKSCQAYPKGSRKGRDYFPSTGFGQGSFVAYVTLSASLAKDEM